MNNQETFIISLEDKKFLQGLINAGRKADEAKGKLQGLSGAVSSLRTAFAGISVAFLGREIVNTLSDFERFEAVLTNTLGSNSAAQKSLREINDFAAKTPFAVDQLTGSYVKLANQGFVPTQKEMRKLGDLASSTGKDFDQLTEAVIDAQVGEFERLKEFGIRASKEGDNVKFTFKGVQTQTKFTETAIRDYILSLGDAQGVSGAMAAISETTGGKISNLGDQVTQLYLNLGQKLKPVIDGTISTLGTLVSEIGNFANWLASGSTGANIFAVAVGALGGAFLAYKVITDGVRIATQAYTVVQWALNAAMTANPIGIVIVAIGALVGAIAVAWQKSAQFRAVIKGLWASIKQVGINIKENFLAIPELVIKAFKAIPKAITQIFSGVGDLMSAVFSGNFSEVPGILKSIVADNALAEVGKEFVGKQIEGAKKVANAFGEAYNQELKDSAAAEEQKKKAEGNKDANSGLFKGLPKPGDTKKGKVLGKGLSEIKSGAPKTFNINIESLIKEQTFNTTNLNESRMKIKEAVLNAMLTAVNDAQVIAE